MAISTVICMLALIGVLVLYVIELSRSRKLLIKSEKTENALRSSEDLSQSILQSVNAFVTLVDNDFVVQRTNFYDITKSPKPESNIVRLGDLLRCNNALDAGGCGKHGLCSKCPIRTTIGHNFKFKTCFAHLQATLNIRNRRGDTEHFIGNIAGEYMITADGREGMVVTVHDITHLKRVEEDLKPATRQKKQTGLNRHFLPT